MYVKAPPVRLRQANAHLCVGCRSTGLSGLGFYGSANGQQLAGFGSKLKKAVKKVARAVKPVVSKVAKIAAPVVGFAIGGPAGAAAGLALSRGVQPGGFNIKLAARGAVYGYVGGLGVQAGLAKVAASKAVGVGVGKGALATVAPAAQAGASASPWSSLFGGAVSAVKPVAVNFARDLLTAKIQGSQAEEVAAAQEGPYAPEPTYYPYPVVNPDGTVSAGAVPAGGGGFLEPGQTISDEELAAAEGQAPPSAAPLVIGAIAIGLLLMR